MKIIVMAILAAGAFSAPAEAGQLAGPGPPVSVTVHQQQLLAMARFETTNRAIVVYDPNAPYKCIGAAIITMQQAGKIVDVVTWDAG